MKFTQKTIPQKSFAYLAAAVAAWVKRRLSKETHVLYYTYGNIVMKRNFKKIKDYWVSLFILYLGFLATYEEKLKLMGVSPITLKNLNRSNSVFPLLVFFSHQHQLYNTSQSQSSISHGSTGKDTASLTNAITLFANSRSIMLETQIHGRILKLGFSNHIFMQNNLIKMYSQCGVFSDGLNVFDGMPERNLVSGL